MSLLASGNCIAGAEKYKITCGNDGRTIDLVKNTSAFCPGCGVFYHRMHGTNISGYVPPPTAADCGCSKCANAQLTLEFVCES